MTECIQEITRGEGGYPHNINDKIPPKCNSKHKKIYTQNIQIKIKQWETEKKAPQWEISTHFSWLLKIKQTKTLKYWKNN